MKKIYFLIVFALVFITSCTIQKRQHLPGYHIEWKGSEARRTDGVKEMSCEEMSTAAHVEAINKEEINTHEVAPEIANVEEGHEEVEAAKSSAAPASEVNGKKKNTGMKLTFPLSLRSPVQLLTGKVMPDEGKKTDGISIAAMVCGILAFFIPYVGIVLAILAIVFGGIGMRRTKANPDLKGRGMAITGLVLGILAFFVVILAAAILATLLIA
jgi:cation transport ATPase